MNEIDVSTDELVPISKRDSTVSIEDHDEFVESTKDQRRAITVEPLVMFYIIVLYLQSSVLSQYIYYRVGVDYNITHNSTLAYICNRMDNGSEERDKANLLQDINSSYMMYIAMCSAVCTILTAPFYCVCSDRYGRRILFFLPGIGSVLKSFFELLAMIFHWPIYIFILTEGLFGLFGGFNFALGLAYSYIADISSSKTRTKRLSILVSMMGIGALSVSFITGYWITAQGYLIPYAFGSGISVLCLVYPLVFLKEPPKMDGADLIPKSFLKQLRTLATIYIGRPRHHTVLLVVMVVMFNFYYVAEMSAFGIISSYLMSFPICMSSIEMSYFSFVNMFSLNIGVAISVIGLARCIPELVLVLLCIFSGLCFSIQMAFANGPAAVFIAAASNLFSFSAFQFIRGFLSKQVGPFEQGALFGSLVMCETVGGAITKVVVVYFYKKTFRTFHGMVFLFTSCFSVIAFVLTVATIFLKRSNNRRDRFKELN